MIKSVIMAGGEGSRLRPLTCDCPKPMTRLCGRPVMEYILELLGEHGVNFAWVTVKYLPDVITRHFGQESFAGVRLNFVEEDVPLGTAGSVKNACGDLDEDLLVISGDALTDFDLSRAIEAHHRNQADATLIIKEVEDPRAYGLVCPDESGQIVGFVEKPSYYQAVSEFANTGIYILSPAAISLIPDGEKFDFAKDLFPLMLERGMRLFAHQDEGYWCDIGDLRSYVGCQLDMMVGNVECNIHGERDERGNVFVSGKPQGEYILNPPVYIGEGVKIGEGAIVEAGSVLDDRCMVGAETHLKRSILLPDSQVGTACSLTGALIGRGSRVGNKCMLFEGAVTGSGSCMDHKSTLMPGAKIWPGRQVEAGERISGHIKEQRSRLELFTDEGIHVSGGTAAVTPEYCVRVGCALGASVSDGGIGICTAEGAFPTLLKAAMLTGVQSQGVDVYDFGSGTQGMYQFGMRQFGLMLGVYIRGEGDAPLMVTSEAGLPIPRNVERKIEDVLSAGDHPVRGERLGERLPLTGVDQLYRRYLQSMAPHGLTRVGARLTGSDVRTALSIQKLLDELGLAAADSLVLNIGRDGNEVSLWHRELGDVPYHRMLAACVLAELKAGRPVALPYEVLRGMDRMALGTRAGVLRYYTCPVDDSDQQARALANEQIWTRDALAVAIRFLHLVHQHKGDIHPVLEEIPADYHARRYVGVEGNPARMIRQLEHARTLGEGVSITHERGDIFIRPGKTGKIIQVFTEAASLEAADELCGDIIDAIRRHASAGSEPSDKPR